jgi:hypothetical protein
MGGIGKGIEDNTSDYNQSGEKTSEYMTIYEKMKTRT